MDVKERLYTVDAVWEMQGWDGERDRRYELIDGELIEMSPANYPHARLAGKIYRLLEEYAESRDLGEASVEGGFYPADDRSTLVGPDVAFISRSRLPDPEAFAFVGYMPDLAVEIVPPSNTVAELRRKASLYLENGSHLVWLVNPMEGRAEICRLDENDELHIEAIDINGALRAGEVLPGFALPLRALFPEAPA